MFPVHVLAQAAKFDAPAPLPAGAATLDGAADGVRRLLDVFVTHGFCTKASTGSSAAAPRILLARHRCRVCCGTHVHLCRRLAMSFAAFIGYALAVCVVGSPVGEHLSQPGIFVACAAVRRPAAHGVCSSSRRRCHTFSGQPTVPQAAASLCEWRRPQTSGVILLTRCLRLRPRKSVASVLQHLFVLTTSRP